MKRILIIGLCFLSFGVFATNLSEVRKTTFEKLTNCDQAIFSDDHFLVTSMPNGATGLGHIHIDSLVDSETFDLPALDRVVDIKIVNNTLYVLTQTTFEAWDIKNKTKYFAVKSHPQISKESSWRKKASGFIVSSNVAIISHSVLGFTIVDLTSGLVQKLLPMPTVSSAQDITLLNSTTAVVAVDNDDEATFRGIYLMDLNTFEITKQIKIDNAFSSNVRVLDNNRLMLGFFNAIWKFELNKAISTKGEPKPTRRAWKFPGLFVVDMRGKVQYDEKYLYGCFNVMDQATGEKEIKPMVFDLETLKLN